MDNVAIQSYLDKTLPTPKYLDFGYIFKEIYNFISPVIDFLRDPHSWVAIGTVSNIISIIFLIIIIFSFVRLIEIQIEEKEQLNKEINDTIARRQELEKVSNPRWHYIETLIESPNESDWRVAVMEADTMLEEVLLERGLVGSTVGDLLESARDGGYAKVQDVWDAHVVRNKIAHEGSDFSLSQVEGRKVIRLYQNFFEELGIIK